MKRFWDKVSRANSWAGCCEWLGSKRDGYGLFRYKGKVVSAHRWRWEQKHGPIPPGKVICHRCDNPSCVRLSHLFLGTRASNNSDRDRKGRHIALVGEQNGCSKLTAALVRQIRRRHQAGEDCKSISKSMPVDHSSVWRAATGRSWSHL